MTPFAHAVREELWSHGRRLESRLSHGRAVEDAEGILATDARDDALVAAAERELERLRASMPGDALVRLVAEAGTEGTRATMTVRVGALSIVTGPEHVDADVALLRHPPPARSASSRRLLWLNGSGAVLLHEAHGHPLEHGLAPLALPPWLEAEVPMTMRRESFRHVPLQRMQHVRVTQRDAPFDAPHDAIEIHLIDGGAYDPLTDVITIRVAASSIGPFEIHEPRTRIRFLGASGGTLRYPGVICSREGQELVVGSYAPVLLTEIG